MTEPEKARPVKPTKGAKAIAKATPAKSAARSAKATPAKAAPAKPAPTEPKPAVPRPAKPTEPPTRTVKGDRTTRPAESGEATQAAAKPATVVTAKASVPKAKVDEAAADSRKAAEEAAVEERPNPEFRPTPRHAMAAPRHAKATPWLKPAPSLRTRIRRYPAPYVLAAIASAIAVAIVLKGRKPA